MSRPEDGTGRPGERPLTNPEFVPASTLPRYRLEVLPFGALNRQRQWRLRRGLMAFVKGSDRELIDFAIRVAKSKMSRRVPTVVPHRAWTPRVSEYPRVARGTP